MIATGPGLDRLTPGLIDEPGRLLDLRPDITSLVVQPDDGEVLVAREWPSSYIEEADALLARIGEAPGVLGVTVRPRSGCWVRFDAKPRFRLRVA